VRLITTVPLIKFNGEGWVGYDSAARRSRSVRLEKLSQHSLSAGQDDAGSSAGTPSAALAGVGEPGTVLPVSTPHAGGTAVNYSLDPADHGVTNKMLKPWRAYLKLRLLQQRGWKSDFSGRKITEITGCHMHEGILSRADLPANVKWHWMIHDPRNCFLLLPDEHIPNPPSREWAISKAYALYGRENVRKWFYETLPWKRGVPFELP